MDKREKDRTKQVLKQLGKRYIKKKRSKTISIITAILLASMFITGLLTAVTGVKKALVNYNIYQFGTLAHAQMYGCTKKEYEQIKEYDSLKETAYSFMLGVLKTEVPDGRNYYLEYIEDKKFQWQQKRLTGTLPKKEKDIVLSTGLLKQLGLDKKIGQEIELIWETNGQEDTDIFSLCGYYESDTNVTTEGIYEGWHIPGSYENIFLSKEYVEAKTAKLSESESKELYQTGKACGTGLFQVDIKFRQEFDLTNNSTRLIRVFQQTVYLNYGYLQKDIFHINIAFVLLYGVVILLAAFFAFWIIFSIFQLSIIEDIHFWGLLQTLGTTEEQFSFFLKHQIILYCTVGIGIGEILVMIAGNMIMPVVLNCFNGTIAYKPVFDLWSILFSGIICILVTIVSCSRIAKKVSKESTVEIIDMELFKNKTRKRKKNDHLGKFRCYHFAWKHISCNYHTFFGNVIPITICLTVFMCSVTILKSVDTSFYVSNEMGNIEIGVFQKEMRESVIKDNSVYINEWKKEVPEPQDWHEIGMLETELYAGETEEIFKIDKIKQYLLKHGLLDTKEDAFYLRMKIDENQDPFYLKLIGMHENIADKMKVTEGNFDKERFATGKYILLTNEQTIEIAKGEKSSFADNPAKACYFVGDKVTIYGKEYEIMAIVDVPYYLETNIVMNEIPFIMKDTEVENLSDSYCVYGSIYCGKNSAAIEKKVNNTILNKIEYRLNLEVISVGVIEQEAVMYAKLFKIIVAFISIFLGIILFLYIINTTIFQVKNQKKMIGMFLSMGMQEKQLKIIWIWERIYETITEISIVTIIGSIVSYTVIRNFCQSTSFLVYKYSIIPVFLLNIVIFLLIIVLILCECKKLLQKYKIKELLFKE